MHYEEPPEAVDDEPDPIRFARPLLEATVVFASELRKLGVPFAQGYLLGRPSLVESWSRDGLQADPTLYGVRTPSA
jgi:hypothetical protein